MWLRNSCHFKNYISQYTHQLWLSLWRSTLFLIHSLCLSCPSFLPPSIMPPDHNKQHQSDLIKYSRTENTVSLSERRYHNLCIMQSWSYPHQITTGGEGGGDNKSTYFRWGWHFPSNQDSWNLCLKTDSFSFILSILDELLWVKFYTRFWHQRYFLLQKQQNEGGVKFQAGKDKFIWTCQATQTLLL